MNSATQQNTYFSVGTLNYSYTMISPYQFHQQEKIDNNLFEFQLNNAFQNVVLKSYPSFNQKNFDWGIAALDLAWKNRFSPLYKVQVGVNSDGKMMNQQQFVNHWNIQLEKVKSTLIQNSIQRQIKKGTKLSREELTKNVQVQIKMCRQFDLFAYKAFVKVLYGFDDLHNINLSSQHYINQRKAHFSKSFLIQEKKRQKTIEMIKNRQYDIFCMQQCNHELIKILRQRLEGYLVVQMSHKLSSLCQSIILLKKTKFPNYTLEKLEQERDQFLTSFAEFIKNPGNFQKKFSAQKIKFLTQSTQMQDQSNESSNNDPVMKVHKQLFWNDDTCYVIAGPLIIFSPHISTKVNLNQQQINHIKKTITKLITYFPDKNFICAGDLNGQFQNQINFQTADKTYIKVNVYPYDNDDVTCYKMRTMTQAQRRKALAVSFCKKDYIITDLKISDQLIDMADGTEVHKANAPLIPNDQHPFDHFIISANLVYVKRIETVSPLRRKKPVTTPWQGFNMENADKRENDY